MGCGKTSVALIGIYLAYRNGYQSTLMCPTESLALQHFVTVKEVLAPQRFPLVFFLVVLLPKRRENKAGIIAGKDRFAFGNPRSHSR